MRSTLRDQMISMMGHEWTPIAELEQRSGIKRDTIRRAVRDDFEPKGLVETKVNEKRQLCIRLAHHIEHRPIESDDKQGKRELMDEYAELYVEMQRLRSRRDEILILLGVALE